MEDSLELIKAYDDFSNAAYALTECISNKAGEDAACSEEYPFQESFDEVASNIGVWVFSAKSRLDKEIKAEMTIAQIIAYVKES
tara:strand:- start:342 stop:593 length:252 start_codon:yes stop_codon:yes gene_type:complete